MTPNARIMLNFIYTSVDGGPFLGNNIHQSADLYGFGMRWQVDF